VTIRINSPTSTIGVTPGMRLVAITVPVLATNAEGATAAVTLDPSSRVQTSSSYTLGTSGFAIYNRARPIQNTIPMSETIPTETNLN
jgi:hypothetical protein